MALPSGDSSPDIVIGDILVDRERIVSLKVIGGKRRGIFSDVFNVVHHDSLDEG